MSVVKVTAVFETSKQKVWSAITNPEIMKIWYFDMSNFKLEIGNEFTFYEPDGTIFFHKCKVLNFEENKLFQHTWTHPEQSKGSSIVTWTIEEIETGKIQVTLSHEGLDTFVDGGEKFEPKNYEIGWNALVKTSLRNYLYNIQKLVFNLEINASAETIWNKLWNKESYTQWVMPFCEGTYFTGEIELGNRIHFIAPSFHGMYSDVFYLIPNELVIFKHIGNLKDLKEQPIDAETEKWTGCFEIYKLKEVEGKTTVTAEIDCMPEYINYMNEKFPLALQELKKISE
ncbi:SRPBCC family protein [Flavobacterium sp. SUN052]|uniref:SRPBCC family protein n=1 Tax=Flavobacterium sp. SUN052 TaxID=3002441 RepID=UPI00237ECCB7|nr:SRPBCC family protein [Flavobacterium sp. SUN052]MEC4004721.1 SRPBCC family protein [Flavobacterium sp. SUN052]